VIFIPLQLFTTLLSSASYVNSAVLKFIEASTKDNGRGTQLGLCLVTPTFDLLP
jgi:hypothetical protein